MASTALLAAIVCGTVSGARDVLLDSSGGMVVAVIVLTSANYVFYLAVNHLIVK